MTGDSGESGQPALALATLGAALPYVVYIFDLADRSATFLNRDFARELGYDPEEMARLGPAAFDYLVHEEDRAQIPELFARWARVADGEFLETEYRLRDARGAYRWFLGRDTVLERGEAGDVRKILGTALDITERKSLEVRLRLSAKLEALGRLAGGIAHDFNNIITAVLGNADLAQVHLNDPTIVGECLDQIRSAAEQASSLTRSLLGFARQEKTHPELVDVNALVTELDRLLRRLLGEGIRVRRELGERVGAVQIDRSQLTQIVLNLAVNARDAMPEGGTLRLATAVREVDDPKAHAELAELDRGVYVVLEVEDDGVGMELETQRRIFDPFFTTKPEQRGSGLGLATVYGIVHQHRGTIVVRSAPGRGSCFTVYLPRWG